MQVNSADGVLCIFVVHLLSIVIVSPTIMQFASKYMYVVIGSELKRERDCYGYPRGDPVQYYKKIMFTSPPSSAKITF